MPVQQSWISKQLFVNMSRTLRELGVPNLSALHHHEISRRRVKQLLEDRWVDLSRKELVFFLALAEARNFKFLELRDHPIWSTMTANAAPITYLGTEEKNGEQLEIQFDVRVLNSLMESGIPIGRADNRRVEDVIRSRNTLFIGSPKFNSATAKALRVLGFNPNVPADNMTVQFSWTDETWIPSPGAELFAVQGKEKGLRYWDQTRNR